MDYQEMSIEPELVDAVAEAIARGWWIVGNDVDSKLSPVEPPWWWAHAMDGSQPSRATTAPEDEALMTVAFLVMLLQDPDARRQAGGIATIERAALAKLATDDEE